MLQNLETSIKFGNFNVRQFIHQSDLFMGYSGNQSVLKL